LLSDPVIKTLLNNNLFTKIQLETLLIDCWTKNTSPKDTPPDTKLALRVISKGKTRGSFNNSLRQAKMKLTTLLHTVLLLRYLGIIRTEDLTTLTQSADELRRLKETDPETEKSQETAEIDVQELAKRPKQATNNHKASTNQ